MNIEMLPIISRLKPTVWTLHDPWALGGHCIHHFDCKKWKTHCGDCPYLDRPFVIDHDDTALKFEIKKQAIQNSDISAIVASQWMEDKVKQSPIWKGKRVYRVPFGVNQDIFKPVGIKKAKEKLGINENDFVLFFRSDNSPYKGLDTIKLVLSQIKTNRNIVILTVGSIGLLCDFKKQYHIKEFGWINNDNKLADLYQACDLFLMPSKQEAFGMMAIEAMSCGKTVVAIANDTALPGTINAQRCGVAVKENDYTTEIQRLINNPNEIVQRGIDSLLFAKSNYNKDVYVKKIIEIYKDVIKNHQTDKSVEHIQEQLSLYRTEAKVKLPIYYRYAIRPILRIFLPKYRIKHEFDSKFGHSIF
jgi:glycosyltransferase involved in cell wall biosynthesis